MSGQPLNYATPVKRTSWWALTLAVNLVGLIGFAGTAMSVNMLGAGIICMFTRHYLLTFSYMLYLIASGAGLVGAVAVMVGSARWADRIGLSQRQRTCILILPTRKRRLVIQPNKH